MRIRIRNHIKIAHQEEHIYEEFDGQKKKIGEKICLTYQNDEAENVLVKFDEREFSMTRYSDNPFIMRFHKDFPTFMDFPHLGRFDILTHQFDLDTVQCQIAIDYSLLQNEQEIATYQLSISWGE